MKSKFIPILVLGGLLLLSTTACNRATMRIYGASTAFPDTTTHYTARTKLSFPVVVTPPSDQRKEHYGQRIAGTEWTSTSTDATWGNEAAKIIQERLVKELSSSGLFSEVATRAPQAGDTVLRTEIEAFSSQVRGFVVGRVVGMSSLRVTLERDGKTIMERKFEKVVTDADKEYTGSQVSFIEQAMKATMADSVRELMKDLLKEIEASGTAAAQSASVK